ncbi:MlaE family lipid ABC transporter permease subunit [Parvularcula marina]|uniref:ABC transporter permease n=1 Tax=Parvularcula marina TaxID=2292771 RepID=UPI003513A484
MASAGYEIAEENGALKLLLRGDWTLRDGLVRIDDQLRKLVAEQGNRLKSIDLGGLDELDTAGAMILLRMRENCAAEGENQPSPVFENASPIHDQLIEQMKPHLEQCANDPAERKSFVLMLDRIGRGTERFGTEGLSILSFVGAVIARIGGSIKKPTRFRMTPLVHHMEEAGMDATLIVGLMSFLIGAVVAFMGARVLAEFGASVFTVELVGITVLREFGVLLTAILLAGRSGSAFTAAIGSRKLREEIDAMRVLGVNPLDALVIPRTIALMLTLPVLAFLAAFLGILGGGIVGWLALDIPPQLFMARTQEIVVVDNLMVGLVKAPFFAFVIAVVGCYHGMNVEHSAEELGRRTTMAVVQSLFLVILIDALFAMLFLELGI